MKNEEADVSTIPFKAYKGKLPYIFVSYAHADATRVYPELGRLYENRYRIWYDQGIEYAAEWVEEIANSIAYCEFFIVFLSPAAVESRYVWREISYASKLDKKILGIFLEETPLPRKFDFEISVFQNISKFALDEKEYEETIEKTLPGSMRTDSSPPDRKIMFAGLDNSGKSSMILFLQRRYDPAHPPRPTTFVERGSETILGIPCLTYDLGGQRKYMLKYFAQPEKYFGNTSLMFFVVDIQEEDWRMSEAAEYLKGIIEYFRNNNQQPIIIICMHKFDSQTDKLLERREHVKQLMETSAGNYPLKFFETSIYIPQSIPVMFSYAMSMLYAVPNEHQKVIKSIGDSVRIKSLVLVNENGFILAKYNADNERGSAFEHSFPQLVSFYDEFKKESSRSFSSLVEKEEYYEAIYTIGDISMLFRVLYFDKIEIYMIAKVEEKSGVQKIREQLGEIKKLAYKLICEYVPGYYVPS